jgi:hypothetical protein
MIKKGSGTMNFGFVQLIFKKLGVKCHYSVVNPGVRRIEE